MRVYKIRVIDLLLFRGAGPPSESDVLSTLPQAEKFAIYIDTKTPGIWINVGEEGQKFTWVNIVATRPPDVQALRVSNLFVDSLTSKLTVEYDDHVGGQ